MHNAYKLYFNDSFALITSDSAQINKNFTNVFETPDTLSGFINKPDLLFDAGVKGNLFILAHDPAGVLKQLMKQVDVIAAGGGIVFNEFNELLMIFRRGKWDLAKGKIEAGESMEEGATREVEEETGVKIAFTENVPIVTYHAYILKGKRAIKRTEWFVMKPEPGQTKLKPQAEEDIEEVRWVKLADLKKYQQGTYLLVWDLISRYVR